MTDEDVARATKKRRGTAHLVAILSRNLEACGLKMMTESAGENHRITAAVIEQTVVNLVRQSQRRHREPRNDKTAGFQPKALEAQAEEIGPPKSRPLMRSGKPNAPHEESPETGTMSAVASLFPGRAKAKSQQQLLRRLRLQQTVNEAIATLVDTAIRLELGLKS